MSPDDFELSESEVADAGQGETPEDKVQKIANLKRNQMNVTFGMVATAIVLVIFLIFSTISLVPAKEDEKTYTSPQSSRTINLLTFKVVSFGGVNSNVKVKLDIIDLNSTGVQNYVWIGIFKRTDFVERTVTDTSKTPSVQMNLLNTSEGAKFYWSQRPEKNANIVADLPGGDYYIILYGFTANNNITVKYTVTQNSMANVVPIVAGACLAALGAQAAVFAYFHKQKLILSPRPKKEAQKKKAPKAEVTIKKAEPQAAPQAQQGQGSPYPVQQQSPQQGQAPPQAGPMPQPQAAGMGYPPQQRQGQQPYPPGPRQGGPPQQYPRQGPPQQGRYPPGQYPPQQRQGPPMQGPPGRYPPGPQQYPPQQPQKTYVDENPYGAQQDDEAAGEFDLVKDEPYDVLNPPEAELSQEEAEELLEPEEEKKPEPLSPPARPSPSAPEQSPRSQPQQQSKKLDASGPQAKAHCPTCGLELSAPIAECPKEVPCTLCGTKVLIR